MQNWEKRDTAYLICWWSCFFSVLHYLCSSGVLSCLCSFRFVLLPFLFSLLYSVFYVIFLSLSSNWDGRRRRCWSFCTQPVVTASKDKENDGHAGFGLCSSSLLLLMLSLEMMRKMVMKACYAGWVHILASVFFLLSIVSLSAPSIVTLSPFFFLFLLGQ